MLEDIVPPQTEVKNPFSWFQRPVKRPEEELTCAGIVIDPDVACVADAHEGSWGVNTHGVFSAVVFSFSTLVNIWGENREKREGENKTAWEEVESTLRHDKWSDLWFAVDQILISHHGGQWFKLLFFVPTGFCHWSWLLLLSCFGYFVSLFLAASSVQFCLTASNRASAWSLPHSQ